MKILKHDGELWSGLFWLWTGQVLRYCESDIETRRGVKSGDFIGWLMKDYLCKDCAAMDHVIGSCP
jgi:hypothetical protein